MTKEQILQEVATSKWQPVFQYSDDLDAVVDSILQPHEDYFLGLHSKVKGIITREILFRDSDETKNVPITFADVCNWQKELFEHKMSIINDKLNLYNKSFQAGLFNNKTALSKFPELNGKTGIEGYKNLIYPLINLPNQHINLGLRQSNVTVNGWNPPHTMFLEDLKEMCFPIVLNQPYSKQKLFYFMNDFSLGKNEDLIKHSLTEWYKVFETIYFFEDLNGRLGSIVINIVSYILTGKYLIK